MARVPLGDHADHLALAADVRVCIRDIRLRDMIDIQSFLWIKTRTSIVKLFA
jgi:hypothetical protein